MQLKLKLRFYFSLCLAPIVLNGSEAKRIKTIWYILLLVSISIVNTLCKIYFSKKKAKKKWKRKPFSQHFSISNCSFVGVTRVSMSLWITLSSIKVRYLKWHRAPKQLNRNRAHEHKIWIRCACDVLFLFFSFKMYSSVLGLYRL